MRGLLVLFSLIGFALVQTGCAKSPSKPEKRSRAPTVAEVVKPERRTAHPCDASPPTAQPPRPVASPNQARPTRPRPIRRRSTPMERNAHTLAYDAARSRVVLHGGSAHDGTTWEWTGGAWVAIRPTRQPGPRMDLAMAYDVVQRRVLLFGGSDASHSPSRAGTPLSDTWQWAGKRWIRRRVAHGPSARSGHAMACDSALRTVVLFGGEGESGRLCDTWTWDGQGWTRQTSATMPPARYGHAMAFDAARKRVVLFGGLGGSGQLGDTWEWDGKNWSKLSTAMAPPARSKHAMAYDGRRQKVVLFGGSVPAKRGLVRNIGDTWEWDGRSWKKRIVTSSIKARSGHAMAYDAARGVVILFGGNVHVGADMGDTWEWNGTTWIWRSGSRSPK